MSANAPSGSSGPPPFMVSHFTSYPQLRRRASWRIAPQLLHYRNSRASCRRPACTLRPRDVRLRLSRPTSSVESTIIVSRSRPSGVGTPHLFPDLRIPLSASSSTASYAVWCTGCRSSKPALPEISTLLPRLVPDVRCFPCYTSRAAPSSVTVTPSPKHSPSP